MKDLIALFLITFSIICFESTMGCSTANVKDKQGRYSRAVSNGESVKNEFRHYVAIDFPFPRTRSSFLYPFYETTVYSCPAGLCILDIPVSALFDLIFLPFDIYGTATGWYNPEYVKPKPLITPSNSLEEKSEKPDLRIYRPIIKK